MKVLIVEDDDIKLSHLIEYVKERHSRIDLTTARSLRSALRAIMTEMEKDGGSFGVILADMTLPTFDVSVNEYGGSTQPYAGREILREMDRRRIEAPVVVITQFDRFGAERDAKTLHELDLELRKDHASNYRGAVYYNPTTDRWKTELTATLRGVL